MRTLPIAQQQRIFCYDRDQFTNFGKRIVKTESCLVIQYEYSPLRLALC